MSDFQFNEKGHYYTLDGKRMYGVTSILGTIAKPALIPWAAKMACEYVRDNSDAFAGDPTMRLVPEQVIKDAEKAHAKKRDSAADTGKDVHAMIEELIKTAIERGGVITKETTHEDVMVQRFIDWAIENRVKFLDSEKQMYTDKDGLFLAGTADFICEIGGKLTIGDIKTYKKIWGREPFLQCAAYGLMYENMTGNKPDQYVIVRIKDGFEAKFSYDVEGDRQGFLNAYKLFTCLENWN